MNKRHILLVEDNPDDAELTVYAFQKSKLLNEVVVANDGAEALDYLFARGAYAGRDPLDLPAVILLDVNLPKVSGIEVLRAIRANEATRLQPVIMLTTSVDNSDIRESYSLGCNAYVQKPVSSEDFLKATSQLGLFWLLANVPPEGADAADAAE